MFQLNPPNLAPPYPLPTQPCDYLSLSAIHANKRLARLWHYFNGCPSTASPLTPTRLKAFTQSVQTLGDAYKGTPLSRCLTGG